jgi:hypothetical protein
MASLVDNWMRSSKPVAIVDVIRVLGLLVPALCFGLIAGGVVLKENFVQGGCHGHGQMPGPAHSCCYRAQQIPGAIPTTRASVITVFITEWISTPIDPQSVADMALATAANDSSPPGWIVLRI